MSLLNQVGFYLAVAAVALPPVIATVCLVVAACCRHECLGNRLVTLATGAILWLAWGILAWGYFHGA
jgi:hypothetical protein